MFNLFITNPNVCCVIKLVSELITLSSSIICVAIHSTHLVGICQLRMNTFFFVSLWYCVIYIIGFDNFCSRITAVVTSKGKELIVTLMNRSYQVITEGWIIDALWSPRCWAWRSWGLEAEEEKKESWATKLKNLLRLNTWMVDTLLSWKIASLREHAVGWNRRDEIIRK